MKPGDAKRRYDNAVASEGARTRKAEREESRDREKRERELDRQRRIVDCARGLERAQSAVQRGEALVALRPDDAIAMARLRVDRALFDLNGATLDHLASSFADRKKFAPAVTVAHKNLRHMRVALKIITANAGLANAANARADAHVANPKISTLSAAVGRDRARMSRDLSSANNHAALANNYKGDSSRRASASEAANAKASASIKRLRKSECALSIAMHCADGDAGADLIAPPRTGA